MAAIPITAANVSSGDGLARNSYAIGEAITAGQSVYINTTTQAVWLANNGAPATAIVKGIALTGSSVVGEFIVVAETGLIKTGATMTAGHLYYLGSTNGTIVPVVDVTADSGAEVSAIYRAKTTTIAQLEINNTATLIA